MAELYLFDTDTDVFVLQEKSVSVDLASNGEYDGQSNSKRGFRYLIRQSGLWSSTNQHPSSQYLLTRK
jgi:hypothetical protein